jgi:glutamate-1-semialdehyde 2,1-aminomutase
VAKNAKIATGTTEGTVELLPPALLLTMSGPQMPVNNTASHTATMAMEGHTSGTSGSDRLRFSRTISDGPCVMVDMTHTPFAVTLARSRLRGIRVGTDRGVCENRAVSTVLTNLAELVAERRRELAARNPESSRLHDEARRVLPGGHTRASIAHEPFPLTFVRGEGAVLVDADGHEYLDLLGDYTAGLFGHGEPRLLDAVRDALRELASVGGVHPHEIRLAGLMCARFGLDRLRFTNSGTEATLMAITTARLATGREKVLVFDGSYHGGVLNFSQGGARWNVPFPYVVGVYNDLPGAVALVEEHGAALAAVIVEPMVGAGGCIPADVDFLRGVFDAAHAVGAIRIADEVMTSRHGRSGLAAILGATADLKTFGKWIGGGFSFGAFGGRAELLDQFDTHRPDAVPAGGTFNNNVATMAAGCLTLGELYTAEIAEAHTRRGERFRDEVAQVLGRHSLPVSVTGYGSMMALHADTAELQELLFLGLYLRRVYTAPRGMINLSLPLTDEQLAAALTVLDETLSELDAH